MTTAVITEPTVSATRHTCVQAYLTVIIVCPFTALLHQLLPRRLRQLSASARISVTIATVLPARVLCATLLNSDVAKGAWVHVPPS